MDEFDRLLYQSSAQLPPDLAGKEPPKPWKRPMGRVLWGLVLINVTLNFWELNVVLPSVGAVLLWLGLRPLRRENGGFRFAYTCATVYAVLRLAFFVLQATPFDLWLTGLIGREWYTTAGSVPLHYALRSILVQSTLTLAVGGLWRGLKGVFLRAGQRPRTAAAGGLVVLEALLVPLALIGLEGWLLVGPILLLWVVLVLSLRNISRSLDEAGYILAPAPVRCPSGFALTLWLGIPLLAAALLPLKFNRLPVPDSTPIYGPSVLDEELYGELLDLGFPEELLAKLDSSRMSMLQGAYGLTVKGWPLSSGPYFDSIPQTVMFEVPVRDGRYGFRTVYLAYLRWEPEELTDSYMEGIQVTPDWHHVTVKASCPEGTLEWRDAGGKYHTAPLAFRFRSDGSGCASYFADFSLPEEADGPVEGWISWESVPSLPEKITVYNYQLVFVHRIAAWQYPYRLPSDVLLSFNGGTSWQTMQRLYEGQLAPEGQYESTAYRKHQ